MVHLQQRDALANLDRCAEEPVHIIGHIQPHGLLFALSEPDLIVRQVSRNVSALLGTSPESALGNSFEGVLGAKQFETFRSAVLSEVPLTATLLRVPVGGSEIEMHCVPHRQGGVLIVELEPLRGAHSLEPLNLDAHIRIPLTHMELASDILELSRLAAKEIWKLTGFDRVMVYRFDQGWNGEVIAETGGPSPVSYLGLRFPATDIPAQARQLFLINPLRTIADVAATAVPIIPEMGPLTGTALDLTRSVLRSASPIHLEYLRNMGVQSSLTVSIVVGHQLWGMIACHHASPRRVDHTTRSVCELIGQTLTSQVAFRIDNVALQARLTSRKVLVRYMAGIEISRSRIDLEHFQSPRLLDLLDADGLVSRIDGVLSSQGTTVEEELLLPVIGKLRKLSSRGIASSSILSALDPGAASFASQVSGALYFGLKEGTDDYLLLLRRELVETVIWAGNPDKAVSTDEQGRLRPRVSFEAWRETVRGHSRPWSELEVESARFLREQLLRLRESQELSRVNKALEEEVKERKRAEADLQKAKETADAQENHSIVTIHSLRQNRGRLRILLVEDNRVNQVLAIRLLEKRGHEVALAGSGRAALEALEKQTFDLVLMDVQMPEMDGLQATALIREGELKSGKHIPIIAMTAHAMGGDREQFLAAGMDGYVSKPLRVEAFFSAIEEVLSIPAKPSILP